MSADTIIKPDKETKAETKPGNYFVSNYPPFSFWKEEEVPCVESMLGSPTPGTAPLGIYYPLHSVESVAASVISEFMPTRILMMFVDTWMRPLN